MHNSLLAISEQKAAIRNIHEPILCKLLNENFSNTIRHIKAQISEVTGYWLLVTGHPPADVILIV